MFLITQQALRLFSCLPILAMCEVTSGSALIFQPPRPVSARQPQTTVWRALLLCFSKNRMSYLVAVLAPSPLFGLGFGVLNFDFGDLLYRRTSQDWELRHLLEAVCCGLKWDRCMWLNPRNLDWSTAGPPPPYSTFQTWGTQIHCKDRLCTASNSQERKSRSVPAAYDSRVIEFTPRAQHNADSVYRECLDKPSHLFFLSST